MLLSTRIWKPSWTIPVIIVFLIITLSISKFTANPLVSVSIVNAGVPNVLLARTKEELDADAAFNYSNPLLKLDTNPIVVLLWNGASWAGWGATGQLDIPNYFTNVKPIPKPQCPVSCTFTIDHSKAGVADAIMLEPTVPFGIASWKSDPPALPEKMPHQTWLLYHYESSEYFPLIAQPPLREVMDGEVSYRQDAWIHATFFCPFASKTIDDIMKPPPVKSDPNKLVVFITSNCGSGGAARRTKYVEQLMKYIPVDSYGACLHNKELIEPHHMRQRSGMQHGDVMARRIEIVSEYKFAVAFENTDQEDDYVTEKVWMTWVSGTVPVYWGAKKIREWLPGDDSIIDASQFTPAQLAAHLRALANNPKAYERLFAWKKQPIRPAFQQLVDNCAVFADCRICKKLARRRASTSFAGLPSSTLFFNAVKFHGELDSVEIPPSPQLDLTNEFTFTAWIFLEAFGYGARILDKSIEGVVAAYSFDILESWGRAYLRLCAAGACHGSHLGLLHQFCWTHVAVTFSVSTGRLSFYIDGEPAGHASITHATDKTDFPLRIGAPSQRRSPEGMGDGVNLLGAVDSVSIWKQALPQPAIRALMFRRPHANESDLVAFWGFDEQYGSEVRDEGIHRLHGRLRGNAHRIAAPRKPLSRLRGTQPPLPTEEDMLWSGIVIGVIFSLVVVLLVVLLSLIRLNLRRRLASTRPQERIV